MLSITARTTVGAAPRHAARAPPSPAQMSRSTAAGPPSARRASGGLAFSAWMRVSARSSGVDSSAASPPAPAAHASLPASGSAAGSAPRSAAVKFA